MTLDEIHLDRMENGDLRDPKDDDYLDHDDAHDERMDQRGHDRGLQRANLQVVRMDQMAGVQSLAWVRNVHGPKAGRYGCLTPQLILELNAEDRNHFSQRLVSRIPWIFHDFQSCEMVVPAA